MKPESCPPFEPKSSLLKRASSSYIGKLFKSHKKPTDSVMKNNRNPYALRSKSNSSIQSVANGTQMRAVTVEQVALEVNKYQSKSVAYDVYQIGRVLTDGSNDFVIRGKLHEHRGSELVQVYGDPALCGPVSRYACRIECERSAPYRSFIYAGGYPKDCKVFIWLIIAVCLCYYLI